MTRSPQNEGTAHRKAIEVAAPCAPRPLAQPAKPDDMSCAPRPGRSQRTGRRRCRSLALLRRNVRRSLLARRRSGRVDPLCDEVPLIGLAHTQRAHELRFEAAEHRYEVGRRVGVMFEDNVIAARVGPVTPAAFAMRRTSSTVIISASSAEAGCGLSAPSLPGYFPPRPDTGWRLRPSRRSQQKASLFDVGVEALAVDGPVEQAGQRHDAVVAQGGEESRGVFHFALRDLVGEPLSPLAPSRAGRVILVFVQVSSMKTSRLGSMSP